MPLMCDWVRQSHILPYYLFSFLLSLHSIDSLKSLNRKTLMIKEQFIKWHLWALICSVVFLVIQYFIPKISIHYWISIWSLIFFSLLSIALYVISIKFIDHENKQLFGSLIMLETFLKIIMAVVLVFVYYKIFQPANKYFIIPFFAIYFIFTVFETIFLVRINIHGSKK